MALFDYQAANAQGRIEKGQLDADSPRGARQLLRGRGLTPVQVSAARSAGGGWGARRLSASELAGLRASWPACWRPACRWKAH